MMNHITFTHQQISHVFTQAAERMGAHHFACVEIRNVIYERLQYLWEDTPRGRAVTQAADSIVAEFARMFQTADSAYVWFGNAEDRANIDHRVTALLLAAHAHELGGVSVPYRGRAECIGSAA